MTDHTEVLALQQRVQALEAEVQTAQQAARVLFAEAPTPYLLLGAQGRIRDVNAVACGLLDRAPQALLERPLAQFLTPASQGSLDTLLAQAARSGLRHWGEVQVLQPDDTPLDVLLEVNAQAAADQPWQFRVVLTEITAYKRAHAQLLDEVADQQGRIEAHATRMRLLNQELGQVMKVFLKELHLPLARALNFLALARRMGQESPVGGSPLAAAEQAVQQLLALAASIERYLRMRDMRIRLHTVNLNTVLQEVLKKLQPSLLDRDVRITADPLPTVQADARALFLILDEYLANAVKFTKQREQARIHVVVQEQDGEYFIGVQDNGAGFNMRQKDKLFQLFGRLHSSQTFEGTGVGLMTVSRCCQRFGARAWAEGKVDQGATFWFAWPKVPRVLD
ncbi:sensor histidine kinase [Deinococcus aquaedulcis]|uniref:sensor histidine kinase n=1 Tax=Deinococcus aquaedulcis TaxID=2840455 RepID=UPI002E2ABACC|nr:ATP-binding protein [Deinococcus aquaedulcis]